MYEINVSTRRVTQYIIDEAYKWLYLRIKAGEYSPNRCKEGRILMVQIEEEQKITEKNYKQFVKMFDNSPFSYMMYRSKRGNCKKITTDVLCNYFVSYNGAVLPLGFVKDFFEDDYETQQEVKALLVDFGKSSKNETAIGWKHMLINKDNAIDHLYDSYPALLKIHPTLLVTQIVRLIITGLLTAWIIIALNTIRFWDVVQQWMKVNKFSFTAAIRLDKGIKAYGAEFMEMERFTLGEYFSWDNFGAQLFCSFIILVVLVGLYDKLIKFFLFAIRMLIHNIQLKQMRSNISKFEHGGIESIGSYYMEVIPSIIQVGSIQDSDSQGVPPAKKLYNKIASFDHQKLADKFSRLLSKYYEMKFAYEEKTLPIVKKSWTAGIVVSVLFTSATAFVMLSPLWVLFPFVK